MLALAGLDSGLGQGNYRFVVYACYLVILAPIVATVVMARLASRRAIRGEAVPAITGAWAGGVMTTLTAVYLVVGVVQLMRPEPAEEPILIGGSGDLRVFFPLGSVILLIGLLTLGLGLFRLRRLD